MYSKINAIWLATRNVFRVLNNLFKYLVFGTLIYSLVYRPKLLADKNILLIIFSAIILSSALIHSILSFGVPRYFLTTQPLAICVILSAAGMLAQHLKTHS
jgi:hypothetical protein